MTITGDSDPKLIVVAAILGPNRGIGLNNDLPWPSIPADLAWLQRITTKLPSDAQPSHKMNAVLLGRVTWQSVPVKEMHLPQRHNVVISRQKTFPVHNNDGSSCISLATSFKEALSVVERNHPRVFVLGGSMIYHEAITMEKCTHLLLTVIHAEIQCDSFFPEIDEAVFRRAEHHELEAFAEEEVPMGRQEWQGLEYEFVMYVRR
ncbi:hypothetical protein K450DRAFT_283858 [Umbelopsis ramanniana AG]|uniref:Dihydrofolate reductase n=1 Tax=Umbelopsis ramanniana AG TaxID=1314678 RepID=A0AAD5H9A5_UMBRA|nr:uncharacterized protein K450DRAFT_283858 [Umbelopsis ramanniana AG]KAI8576017.1 hypothetical protein K450DRAFT_283858 [Umbelopsis ramanniana AG]